MAADQLPRPALEWLRWSYAVLLTLAVAALLIAALLEGEVGGDVPGWLGAIVVVAVGVAVLFVVRYYLRRPLEHAGTRDYAVTVLFRTGAALVPAAVGFGMFVASGGWWLSLLGTGFTLAGLTWAVPSQADYQRHRRLATHADPHPPEQVWGDTPPGYVAPWEAEPGHGHGLQDH